MNRYSSVDSMTQSRNIWTCWAEHFGKEKQLVGWVNCSNQVAISSCGYCTDAVRPHDSYVIRLLQILSTFYTKYFLSCPFAVAGLQSAPAVASQSITSQLQCTPPEISTKGVTPGFVKWCLKLPNFWLTLSNGNRSFIHSFTKWMGLFSCVSNILV